MTEDQLLTVLAVGLIGTAVGALGTLIPELRLSRFAPRVLALSLLCLALAGAAVMLGVAEPVTMATIGGRIQPLFYGMALSLDRFAAIAVFATAFVTLLAWPREDHHGRARTALVTLAASLMALSGNIVGVVTGLSATALLAAFGWQTVRELGAARVFLLFLAPLFMGAGYFILSGGALFSDIQTVGMLAAGLPTSLLTTSLALGMLGYIAWLYGAVLCRPSAHEDRTVAIPLVMLVAGVYAFGRMTVFMSPELSLAACVAFAGFALLQFLTSFYVIARREDGFVDMAANSVTFLLALALLAIAQEQWGLMNVAMFGVIVSLTVLPAVLVARHHLAHMLADWRRQGDCTGLAHAMPWFSLAAFVMIFAGAGVLALYGWMTLHGALGGLRAPAVTWVSVAAVSAVFVWLFGLLISTTAWIAPHLAPFLGRPTMNTVKGDPDLRSAWPVYVAAALAAFALVLAPSMLVRLGAGALTKNAGTLQAMIDTGVGSVMPVVVVGVIVLLALIIGGLLRGTEKDEQRTWDDLDADETDSRIVAWTRVGMQKALIALRTKGELLLQPTGKASALVAQIPYERIKRFAEPGVIVVTILVLILLAL